MDPFDLVCNEALDDENDLGGNTAATPDDADAASGSDDESYLRQPAFPRRGSTATSEDSDYSPDTPTTPPPANANDRLAEDMLYAIDQERDYSGPEQICIALRKSRNDHLASRSYLVVANRDFGYVERHGVLQMLLKASHEVNMPFEAVAVAANVLDRFVVARSDIVRFYPLAAVVSFGLACKVLFDMVQVKLSDLLNLYVRYTGDAHSYTIADVARMEQLILTALDYRVSSTTATTIVAQVVPCFAVPVAQRLDFVQRVLHIVQQTSVCNQLMHFAPHTVALASIRAAIAAHPLLGDGIYWAGINTVLTFTDDPLQEVSDLDRCAEDIEHMLGMASMRYLAASADALSLHAGYDAY